MLPRTSNSFLWQHFHYFIELGMSMKKQKTLLSKIGVLFARPDSIDPHIRDKAEKLFCIKNNTESSGTDLNRYILVQVIISLVTLFVFIPFEHHMQWKFQALFTFVMLLTLINCGAILEQRRSVFYLEYIHMGAIIGGLLLYYPSTPLAFSVILLVPLSLYYLASLRNAYPK